MSVFVERRRKAERGPMPGPLKNSRLLSTAKDTLLSASCLSNNRRDPFSNQNVHMMVGFYVYSQTPAISNFRPL